jgi:hypothetical protein
MLYDTVSKIKKYFIILKHIIQDPTTENRMECTATVILGLAKRYNGLTENRCEFRYKDIEKYATQSARNVFYCKLKHIQSFVCYINWGLRHTETV